MRHPKLFAFLTLAAGMAIPGAATLSAQEWRYRDLDQDYARLNLMRDHIARDRAQLDEDIRCGRTGRAARDAEDLARDQRALNDQRRDIRQDQYTANRYRWQFRGGYRDWRYR